MRHQTKKSVSPHLELNLIKSLFTHSETLEYAGSFKKIDFNFNIEKNISIKNN